MDKRERYEHTHTPQGYFLHLATTQDAEGDHCPSCGRTVVHEFNHAFECPVYRPDPNSIAATKQTAQEV